MIADLQQGNLDWVDQVPFNAVDVLKEDDNIVVNEVPGAETTNITWNSNPRKPKNRELLDPQVKKALSMCVDREQIIEVVFNGYATLVESLVGHIAGDWRTRTSGRSSTTATRRTRCSTTSATRAARTASGSRRRRPASTRRPRTR